MSTRAKTEATCTVRFYEFLESAWNEEVELLNALFAEREEGNDLRSAIEHLAEPFFRKMGFRLVPEVDVRTHTTSAN